MKKPEIDESVFVAEGAVIRGNVTIGKNASVWFNAVIRSEEKPVVIGEGSNVQDNAVVHVDPWTSVTIGKNVTIGHGAIVHGCTIGDNTLVGMGAVVMNDAVIGKNCIIGAGALVTENTVIPDNSLVIGMPAKVRREVSAEEAERNRLNAEHYVEISREYKRGEL